MAKRELSPEEKHARAYDSYDFPDYEEDDGEPDELDDYIKGVLNAPDPTAVSPAKKPPQ